MLLTEKLIRAEICEIDRSTARSISFSDHDDRPAMTMDEGLDILAMRVIPDGFTISDARIPDYPLVYVNSAFLELTGYPAEEILGRNCRFLNGPLTSRETIADISRALASGGSFVGEILNYRRDGTPFWNLLRIAPVRNDAGAITHFLGMQTDISEFKNQELDNQRLRDSLASMNHAASISAMSASIGHEINQPLTAVLSNAYAGLNNIKSGNMAELRDSLTEIVEDARRASNIVERTNELVQQKARVRQAVDLNEAIVEAVSLQSTDIAGNNIDVHLALEDNLPEILGSRVQCLQILVNIIRNASDAISSNGSPVRSIRIATRSKADAVEVSIADTGCGADEHVTSHMFDPLFTTKESGSGMGLLVCRAIIESHKGEIAASNNPDGGLTVRFTLPTV